jgi:hypothetical protein
MEAVALSPDLPPVLYTKTKPEADARVEDVRRVSPSSSGLTRDMPNGRL